MLRISGTSSLVRFRRTASERSGVLMNATETGFSAPFSPGYRRSGVLLHVTSLPSRFGIGDLGPVAFAWIDRLASAGQTWWQVLPLGPTGYGHSPYQALSSFAANPLVISPEQLVADIGSGSIAGIPSLVFIAIVVSDSSNPVIAQFSVDALMF